MLLPSDVARLVLGYLQQEGLSATSQAFIHESPNLKEYADHTTGDGTIPACVFSIFGKGLTTILNEYVATKAKESSHEVPLVMTSLWKKLDFTLNQIKSLQNSPAISASQRTRSRVGMANMARQRVLTMASASGVICSSVSETSSIISPAHTSHSMLGHSTPVCYTRPASSSGAQQQIHDGSRLLNTPRDSPAQVIVTEHRLSSGPTSPGRRKWETPRKRSGAVSGSSGPPRSATTVSSVSAEPQPEEVVDENFPQLVIQNARDKILGDKSLQEKLAENINKILANEPAPQASKVPSTVEADQSIDEILGLQGEIHMSDDAIHDILEHTESDPAFQALFDLFDYHKTKFTDGETGDGDISSSPEEIDSAGPSSAVRTTQSYDPGATQRDLNVSETTSATLKMRAVQERKTRKSAASTLLKKTVIDSSGRSSRIENSSARLLVSHGEHSVSSSAPLESKRKDKSSCLNNSGSETPMDIDEPLNTPPPPIDTLSSLEPTIDSPSTSATLSKSATVPLSKDFAPSAVPEDAPVSNVEKNQGHEQAQESNEQPATTSPLALSDQTVPLSPVEIQLNDTILPHASVSSSGEAAPASTLSVPSVSAGATLTPASFSSVSNPTAGSPTTASTSAIFSATATSSTLSSPLSSKSCAQVATTFSPSSTNPTTPSKAAGDPDNIVSLKIIISDNQEVESSSNTALNQAISSIAGDKIPTIYLSSPAKSPGGPGTPKTNFDEVAQAVCGLQSAEAAGAVMASPLIGTSQAQQRYIIQLPVETSNPALQGSTTNYFLVTPTPDVAARQVLLPAGVSQGQPLPTNQWSVTAPTPPQTYGTGPSLILPSPIKPVVLPVSVMRPNTLGNIQVVSNQLVDMSNPVPVPVQQPKPMSVENKQSSTSALGSEKNQAGNVIQLNTEQQDAAKGSTHRRILCFDSSSSEVQSQTAKTTETMAPTAANTSRSKSIQLSNKEKKHQVTRTKPTILAGNKPKRRIEPVRCSSDSQTVAGSLIESVPLQTQQKEPLKKNSRKQEHNIYNKEFQNDSINSASQPEAAKKESGESSKPTDRKHNNNTYDETKVKDSRSTTSLSSDSALKSGSGKDKEESSRKEPAEKSPLMSYEGTEKRTSSLEMPNVTANKENEIQGSMLEQQQQSATPSSSESRDFSPPAVTQLISTTQPKAVKAPSKTSSLAKQAAEMLQNIQGLTSPSTPLKKTGAGSSDHSLPGTGLTNVAPSPRTPSRKKGKDGEGTPKHLKTPNTPDIPTCSPASEAGSENSINMAAHTLMILSRAAIARTGTPLKDSLRQEEVGEKSPTSSKNTKKRKHSSPTGSPPAKRGSKQSIKKKEKEKKLIDCFPHDLDVDKFLSSLHYDE
ncbi:protein NPAT [Melanotaenia boesemani]|uniref:protein NPAT n=1 Tax=Melanotaenia boesemani TaxID=1250792 RepID=UPI001C049231|nr:protein NPAT [Melanotaenia boesemani]